ncbi:MAG: hypothetical protein V1716_00315 [Candidatus Uhrbacteria bacterium]
MSTASTTLVRTSMPTMSRTGIRTGARASAGMPIENAPPYSGAFC